MLRFPRWSLASVRTKNQVAPTIEVPTEVSAEPVIGLFWRRRPAALEAIIC
jgi:hypothetical protein